MANQGEGIPQIIVDSADSMNQALRSVYERRLPELVGGIENCIDLAGWERKTVSRLFLMEVEEEYGTAPTKILFVGTIDHLIAPGHLPKHTYQISHPNYLRHKPGGHKTNADKVINPLALLIEADSSVL